MTQKDKELHVYYDENVCIDVELSFEEEINLELKAKSELMFIYRKNAMRLIGTGFYAALERRQKGDTTNYFSGAAKYINAKAAEAARMSYILSAFIVALAVSLPFFLTKGVDGEDSLLPFLGGAFGAVGAFISVLQRFQKIKIEEFASNWFVSIGGMTRVFLGFMFGVAFVILEKAGIVLNTGSNTYLVYSFAIISGFSERFIPDLLEKESKTKNPNALMTAEERYAKGEITQDEFDKIKSRLSL